jgi:centrosomal protein CEP135
MNVEFGALRRRLDECGYLQPLGIESMPLVQHLLSDLLHTTAALKETKVSECIILTTNN